jgi:hypothetical protein
MPTQALGGRSATLAKILSRFSQTQYSIRSTTDNVCIMVVLSVILPKAHITNLIHAALSQRTRAAARTRIQTAVCCWAFDDVGEWHDARSGLTTKFSDRRDGGGGAQGRRCNT